MAPVVTPGAGKPAEGSEIVYLDRSQRLETDEYRTYKFHDGASENILYVNIINFKRCSNPGGRAHHCVMCGDKNAAIPSQNKDVCKTCDTGFWLVKQSQTVVKFCKGCKNFAKLWEFRDKPEATKCIKCRQRGRMNYFSKKAEEGQGGGLGQMMHGSSDSGGGAAASLKHLMDVPLPNKAVGADDVYQSFAEGIAAGRGNAAGHANVYNNRATLSAAAQLGSWDKPHQRARSRTLDFGTTEINTSSLYDYVADHELNAGANVLLATSSIPEARCPVRTSSRPPISLNFTAEMQMQWCGESEKSPRAALLHACLSDTHDSNSSGSTTIDETAASKIMQQPLSPFAKSVAEKAAFAKSFFAAENSISSSSSSTTSSAGNGGKNKQNALFELAELSSERMIENVSAKAPHQGSITGRKRDRGYTLDMGSLGVLSRAGSFMTKMQMQSVDEEKVESSAATSTLVPQSRPEQSGEECTSSKSDFHRVRTVSTTSPPREGISNLTPLMRSAEEESRGSGGSGESKVARKRSITSPPLDPFNNDSSIGSAHARNCDMLPPRVALKSEPSPLHEPSLVLKLSRNHAGIAAGTGIAITTPAPASAPGNAMQMQPARVTRSRSNSQSSHPSSSPASSGSSPSPSFASPPSEEIHEGSSRSSSSGPAGTGALFPGHKRVCSRGKADDMVM